MKRRKGDLIPFEKSKKVIYLEKRGKLDKKPVGAVLSGIFAALCLLYCIGIALFVGYGSKFFLIWGVIAVLFGGLSVLLAHREWLERIPKWLKRCFVVLVSIGLLFFIMVEGMIFSRFGAKAQPGADYVVVLGAQWKPSGPSYLLQKRLDVAAKYLLDNPETKVIVSGGQGPDEPVSEAQGMSEYLMQAGVEEERILLEDRSTNTCQNLTYSGELLDKDKDRVVLVTNNFHMFRALQIAQKQGYTHIEGLSAGCYSAILPNNLFREFFGTIKDFLVGNL